MKYSFSTSYMVLLCINLNLYPLISLGQKIDLPDEYAFTHCLDLDLEVIGQGELGEKFTVSTKFHYSPKTKTALWRPIESNEHREVRKYKAAQVPEQYTFSQSMDLLMKLESPQEGAVELLTKLHYSPDSENAIWRPIEAYIEGEASPFNREGTIFDIEQGFVLEMTNSKGTEARRTDLPDGAASFSRIGSDWQETNIKESIHSYKSRKIISITNSDTLEIWSTKKVKAPSYFNWLLIPGKFGLTQLLPMNRQFVEKALKEEFPIKLKFQQNNESESSKIILTITAKAFNDKDNFSYSLKDVKIITPTEEVVEEIEAVPDDLEDEFIEEEFPSEEINILNSLSPKETGLAFPIEYPFDWQAEGRDGQIFIYSQNKLSAIQSIDLNNLPEVGQGIVMLISVDKEIDTNPRLQEIRDTPASQKIASAKWGISGAAIDQVTLQIQDKFLHGYIFVSEGQRFLAQAVVANSNWYTSEIYQILESIIENSKETE